MWQREVKWNKDNKTNCYWSEQSNLVTLRRNFLTSWDSHEQAEMQNMEIVTCNISSGFRTKRIRIIFMSNYFENFWGVTLMASWFSSKWIKLLWRCCEEHVILGQTNENYCEKFNFLLCLRYFCFHCSVRQHGKYQSKQLLMYICTTRSNPIVTMCCHLEWRNSI